MRSVEVIGGIRVIIMMRDFLPAEAHRLETVQVDIIAVSKCLILGIGTAAGEQRTIADWR